MTTMHPGHIERGGRWTKPAVGRPVLFALLLIAGPSLALPLAIGCAASLVMLVGVAWAVAGPRL